jgi:1-acyl-sn-glycerol-3-phosphate acyltransferase
VPETRRAGGRAAHYTAPSNGQRTGRDAGLREVGEKGGALDWHKFDTAWARRPGAQAAREVILTRILGPVIEHYTHPTTVGREIFDGLKAPVVFAANHSSHLDTPSILRAFPRDWRRKTAPIAAADYFYKNRVVASLVTLSFATFPIERRGLSKLTTDRLARLIDDGWSVLVYPEGTRSRNGEMGTLRSGAGFIAVEHSLPLVPIFVMGTSRSMPVGRPWPRKHAVVIYFGTPIYPAPGDDHRSKTAQLQQSLARMRRDSSPFEQG